MNMALAAAWVVGRRWRGRCNLEWIGRRIDPACGLSHTSAAFANSSAAANWVLSGWRQSWRALRPLRRLHGH